MRIQLNIIYGLLAGALFAFAQETDSLPPSTPPPPTVTEPTGTEPTGTATPPTGTNTGTGTPTGTGGAGTSGPPDVVLHVPELSVGRIELDVDNLQADINLHANVASLVSINAGVALSIQKINLTIVDVNAELDLVVRLGHLADIVNRVFDSLDLNPLLIAAVNNVTNLLEPIVGAIDGLLGTVTQGGNTLSFLVDNFGNIVQQVLPSGGEGNPVSSIVGDFRTNMTATGATRNLGNGLVERTFSYAPLNALVNIVFNTAGQVVQAAVAKATGGGGGATPTPTPTPTGGARR